MRIQESVTHDRLSEMGFTKSTAATVRRWLDRPFGLIVVTGPTGCGKSTTLYSTLDAYDADARKVVTVESPIEYDLPGVNQIVLTPATGLTWESAIRAQLQQDPDVMLISEVVSPAVAESVVRVALAGHVVRVAFHAPTAEGVLRRLLASGVDRRLLTESRIAILAQRLVRRLCPDCRQPDPDPEFAGIPSPLPEGTLYKPSGCSTCHQTGYRGRIAVHETLEPTSGLLETLDSAEAESADPDTRPPEGAPTRASAGLLASALERAAQGVTSLDEARRVIDPA